MKKMQIALTIAGSDSGGGAGIQADLKTFAALDVHGTSVVTCLTAQNPKRILGIAATEPAFVTLQLETVFSELPPRAVKTGMLYSPKILRAVIDFFSNLPKSKRSAIIVDPVMVATSGTKLSATEKLPIADLLQLATLVTPNLSEAEALLGRGLKTPEDLRWAARALYETHGCAALLKGGHLHGRDAVDFFYDGATELMLTAPRVKGVKTHGTGCTYSAAIAAWLARGEKLPTAIAKSKNFITNAILKSVRVENAQTLRWTSPN